MIAFIHRLREKEMIMVNKMIDLMELGVSEDIIFELLEMEFDLGLFP